MIAKKSDIISVIKKENRERQKRQLDSISKAYDYMLEHEHRYDYGADMQIYLINGNECICNRYDFRYGELEFTPLDSTSNIGTEHNGGRLMLEF